MTSAFRDSVLVRLPGIGRTAQIVEPTGTWNAAQVSSGVVFIHAPWSGPSCMALLALDHALMQEDLIGIPVYILDSDGLDGKFQVGKSIDQRPYRLPEGKTWWQHLTEDLGFVPLVADPVKALS